MIIEVKETTYMGFDLHYVEKMGWQIVLNDVNILFPTMQDAQGAIRDFYKEIVPKHYGKKCYK